MLIVIWLQYDRTDSTRGEKASLHFIVRLFTSYADQNVNWTQVILCCCLLVLYPLSYLLNCDKKKRFLVIKLFFPRQNSTYTPSNWSWSHRQMTIISFSSKSKAEVALNTSLFQPFFSFTNQAGYTWVKNVRQPVKKKSYFTYLLVRDINKQT